MTDENVPSSLTISTLRLTKLDAGDDWLTLGGYVEEFHEFVGMFNPTIEEYEDNERAYPLWEQLLPAHNAAHRFEQLDSSALIDRSIVAMLQQIRLAIEYVPRVLAFVSDAAAADKCLMEDLTESGKDLIQFKARFCEITRSLE